MRQAGLMTIRTDDMETAGEMVQDLCGFLQALAQAQQTNSAYSTAMIASGCPKKNDREPWRSGRGIVGIALPKPFFQVTELESSANFPAEMEKFQQVLTRATWPSISHAPHGSACFSAGNVSAKLEYICLRRFDAVRAHVRKLKGPVHIIVGWKYFIL